MFHQQSDMCIRTGSCLALAIAAGGFCCGTASAQSGAHIVVMDDGGGEPMISHFTMPDIASLREPDFVRKDLPIFTEKLVLSEPQTAAIERQIEVYLAAFEKLMKDLLNLPGVHQPMVISIPPGEDGEEGGAMVMMAPALDDMPMPMWNLEEMVGEDGELPEDMTFSIGVQVEVPDGEGGGDGAAPAQPGVEVSFDSDAEIPDEVRKQMEQHAQELAEKIKKQIEEQQAAGVPPQEAQVGNAAMDIEQFKQRQGEFAEAAKKFSKAKSELRQNFVVEAQTTLSPSQVERWPALERALLREKSLPKGRLSGERTNLFKVVKNTELGEGQMGSLTPTLDAYDIELDTALRQRNDIIEDVTPKIDQAIEKREYDRALAAMDRASAARVAVRTLNERFTDALAELLPADVAAKFRAAVLKASYPQVYRTTLADRTLDAALKLEGLSGESKEQLAGLQAAYRAEREEMDGRIRKTIDRYQPIEGRRAFEHMKAASEGGGATAIGALDEPDPISEAMTKRRELDERYINSVKGFLSPEQIEQLPKPPVRKQGQPIIIRRTVNE